MPYTSTRRKYAKRWSGSRSRKTYAAARTLQRFARRNRRRNRSRTLSRRYPSILPTTRRARLRYVHQDVTGTAGQATPHTFRLNSIYDPWGTGLGDRAQGAMHLAGLYDKYMVLKAHAKVDWYRYGEASTSTGTTYNQEPYIVYIRGDDDTAPESLITSASSLDKFPRTRTSKYKIMKMNDTHTSLSITYDAKTFARSKSPDIAEYGAEMNNNPAKVYSVHVNGTTFDGSVLDSPAVDIKWMITITYDILCFRDNDSGIPA